MKGLRILRVGGHHKGRDSGSAKVFWPDGIKRDYFEGIGEAAYEVVDLELGPLISALGLPSERVVSGLVRVEHLVRKNINL